MQLAPFMLWTGLGSVIWTTFLTLCGFWLEAGYASIVDWIDPVAKVVLAGLVVLYLYRLLTWRAV